MPYLAKTRSSNWLKFNCNYYKYNVDAQIIEEDVSIT